MKFTPVISHCNKIIITSTYEDEFNKEAYGLRFTKANEKNFVANYAQVFLDGHMIDAAPYHDAMTMLKENGNVPTLYVVRSLPNYSFVCGLDLTDKGYWVGVGNRDSYFPTVNEALAHVRAERKDWIEEGVELVVCLEEPMRV